VISAEARENISTQPSAPSADNPGMTSPLLFLLALLAHRSEPDATLLAELEWMLRLYPAKGRA